MKRMFNRRFFPLCAAALFCCGAFVSAKAPAANDMPKRERVVEMISDVGTFISKNVENRVGDIRLQLRGIIGSFQVSVMNEAGSFVPLLSGHDEFTSSFFALLAGRREYKLTDNVGIVVGARESETGAQLVYIVPKVARVFVKFDCISSVPGKPADILKITAIVLNRGKRTETFALKTVLDTVLGEQTETHFSTAQDATVNSEMQFRSIDTLRWICSENDRAAMRIMVHGADCSPVEVVSLGNKDLLALPAWIPSVSRSKTFDSVLSYNNSAVCINWQGVRLAPEEEASFVYYISVAADGQEPAGDDWIAEFSPELQAAGANGVPQERSDIKFVVESIDPEKLDFEYIQGLLDRIDALESGDAAVDRAELLRLNAELDAILEKLR